MGILTLAGCVPSLTTLLMEPELPSEGLWVRVRTDAAEEPLHSFWLSSDPDFDCYEALLRMFPSERPDPVPDVELQVLFNTVRGATTAPDRCRALVAYHEAVAARLPPGPPESVEVALFIDDLTGRGWFASEPEPGVTYFNRTAASGLPEDWAGFWRWELREYSARFAEALDCEAADDGRAWLPDLVSLRAGALWGTVVFDERRTALVADLSLGLEDPATGLVGTVEGRARFARCDVAEIWR